MKLLNFIYNIMVLGVENTLVRWNERKVLRDEIRVSFDKLNTDTKQKLKG